MLVAVDLGGRRAEQVIQRLVLEPVFSDFSTVADPEDSQEQGTNTVASGPKPRHTALGLERLGPSR